MSRTKKILLTLLAYLTAFIAAVCVSSFVLNQGKVSGEQQRSSADLPLLYVRTGGELMNEMHGYTEPVDGGYYRDTLTPVGESKTINLSMDTYGHNISSVSFELYNDQYTDLIESGDCTDMEKVNAMVQMQLQFKNTLYSNREYCLHLMLKNDQDQVYHYYTRVRYGSDLKVAEKLKFVLDFNETTFNKDSADALSSYLESTSSSSSSDKSLVTLYSSSDTVTWGSMAPYRTSEIAIRLKEINTETAAFTLSYTIESSAGDINTFYNVNEYYRLRWTDSKVYLLDFERRMAENIGLADITVSSGALRLGIGDASDIDYASYGTDQQQYTWVTGDQQLWLYDNTNRIMTKVYTEEDDNHNCGRQDEAGIKVVHADPETGDLYFIVYGYMHSGNYEGREGVMVYHFSHEDVLLEDLVFIPFNKGFEQMRSGLEELAYMNDDGTLYLLLEDTVYAIDVNMGKMDVAYKDLNSSNCTASGDGIFVMCDGGDENAGERLKIVDLNSGKERTIEGGDWRIVPLGYAGKDLIYGLIDPQMLTEDSSGVIRTPISEVHIMDENYNEVKTYQKSGDYVMRLTISDGNISMKLAKAVKNGNYTDYQDAGEDYIIRNIENDDQKIYVDKQKDSIRGQQNWLHLNTSDSFVPISQSARYLDPGYDISRKYEDTDQVEMQYYVYTKGRMDAAFATIQEAVDYGTTYAGTIMTSHKQVIWQKAGRAYIWDLNIDSIDKTSNTQSMNSILIKTIADYEGWELNGTIDDAEPLFAAMTAVLPAESIDLSGLKLDDVLHFVYRDRVVAVKLSNNNYGLITAYDNDYVWIADPAKGEVYSMTQTAAEKLFEQNGKVYYSYMD